MGNLFPQIFCPFVLFFLGHMSLSKSAWAEGTVTTNMVEANHGFSFVIDKIGECQEISQLMFAAFRTLPIIRLPLKTL